MADVPDRVTALVDRLREESHHCTDSFGFEGECTTARTALLAELAKAYACIEAARTLNELLTALGGETSHYYWTNRDLTERLRALDASTKETP